MLESAIKRKIVEDIRKAGGYARRIEDKYTVGMPDMMIALVGTPVFIMEVKKFTHLSFAPSARQLIELQRMGNVTDCMVPVVVGWRDGIHYISEPKEVIQIPECVFTKNREHFHETLLRWYDERRATKGKNIARGSAHIGQSG